MKSAELDYELPPELIAQHPAARRDESRLLVHERASGETRAPDASASCRRSLPTGTLVVVNDTRVVPARIAIERPRGEVLLLERLQGDEWVGLARPTRRLRAGARYGPVELLEHLGEGRWRLRLDGEPAGEMPLPPYITEPLGGSRPLPDGLRARATARPPRRPRGCTSRRSCSPGSTSSA